MNEPYRHTLALRAVRRFTDRPLPAEDLERILEAGRWTGSSRNSQPWELLVVTDAERRAALSRCGRFARPLEVAAAAVALVGHPRGSEFDLGRLAQNIMLAASALGIGSCPVTLHDEDAARRLLEVPPTYRCRFAVALGYPAASQSRLSFVPPGRRALTDLVHWESFGSSI